MHQRLIAPALASLLASCGGKAVIDSLGSGGASSSSGSGGSSSTSSSSGSGGEPVTHCDRSGSSTLEGVSIEFPEQRCTFTLAEAQAGIAVDYQVIVDHAIGNVIPRPQDWGQCGGPSAGGLIVFEQLGGNGQSYCLCDTGMCMPPPDLPVTLVPGVYGGSFLWDGVNWTGPSDYGNPKGLPFPAGSYRLEVSARGDQVVPDATIPFEVIGTFELTLVP